MRMHRPEWLGILTDASAFMSSHRTISDIDAETLRLSQGTRRFRLEFERGLVGETGEERFVHGR